MTRSASKDTEKKAVAVSIGAAKGKLRARNEYRARRSESGSEAGRRGGGDSWRHGRRQHVAPRKQQLSAGQAREKGEEGAAALEHACQLTKVIRNPNAPFFPTLSAVRALLMRARPTRRRYLRL